MFMQDIARVAATPVTAANSALSQGIFGPTLIDTEHGWRAAHSLRIGERVHTLDGGLQRIAALSRRFVTPGERAIKVSGGYFDADDDVLLLPAQGILLQTLNMMTAPYARVQARALAACIGASHALAPQRAEIVTPIFAEEEAIWAQSGLLLLCPGVRSTATAFPEMHAQAANLFVTERSRRFA